MSFCVLEDRKSTCVITTSKVHPLSFLQLQFIIINISSHMLSTGVYMMQDIKRGSCVCVCSEEDIRARV
jgi:hypothetical protein